MRILVHDYAGHPFQVQLSRQLAKRGHEVLHAYCGSTHTPQGAMARRPDDSDSFQVECLDLGSMIPKYGYLRRLRMEYQYGRLLVDVCKKFQPEVVLSGNTPSIPQKKLSVYCRRHNIRHVFWVQDIYGMAAYKMLTRKSRVVGHLVGNYFLSLDKTVARLSKAVVVISPDFSAIFQEWGIDENRIRVIQNWSVLEELPLCPRENSWSQQQELGEGPRFVYTGTLSIKHNPALLLSLGKMLDAQGTGELVVVSEGSGIEWLRSEAKQADIKSIKFLDFQPFEILAEVLGSADVLLTLLEPDAGIFCVPSKILSYMCAGRAQLAAMPEANLAARIITDQQAGLVVAPNDVEGFCAAAQHLMKSPEERATLGRAARCYAEEHFDIERIATLFEETLQR